MDRNEKFRRQLANKLNQSITRDSSVQQQNFDPTPYVDILMDKIYWEDADVDDIEDSIEEMSSDSELDFILGGSSLMNLKQKQTVIKALQQRVNAIIGFDPEPFSNKLLAIWDTAEFKQYIVKDDDDDDDEVLYDFTTFYNKHNLTKEQGALVKQYFLKEIGDDEDEEDDYDENYDEEDDYDEDYDEEDKVDNEAGKVKEALATQHPIKVYTILILSFVIVVILPFFIPNYLQRIGWLSLDTGWFFKIFIGAVSAFIFFKIAGTIFRMFINRALKNLARYEKHNVQ
jgi:hypothetical protein